MSDEPLPREGDTLPGALPSEPAPAMSPPSIVTALTPSTTPAAAALARIEVLDRDGRVRHAHAVTGWPVAIGRAIDNDIVLDDPHVAAYHARIEAGPDGAPRLRVLPGLNGLRHGRERLAPGGEPVSLAALASVSGASGGSGGGLELTAGQTRLRVRRTGDALEPERGLAAAGSGPAGTLLLAVLLWLWVLAEHWIALDPGSKASDWLPPLLGAPLALAGWCLLWGLASKIFQHRFEFWPHVAVAVRGLLAVEVTNFVLLWLSALTGWPLFAQLITGVAAAIGAVTLWAHARLVLPQQRRALAYGAAAAYVAGAAILMTLNQQRSERWFGELYAHMLPPPALMWQKPTGPDAFVKRAERLLPALRKSTAEAAEEQKAGGDDDDE
jgi:hypothetical protein